eukprot:COSAG06_NODE_2543_length_6702_cov_2.532031_1_plen_207_part_10
MRIRSDHDLSAAMPHFSYENLNLETAPFMEPRDGDRSGVGWQFPRQGCSVWCLLLTLHPLRASAVAELSSARTVARSNAFFAHSSVLEEFKGKLEDDAKLPSAGKRNISKLKRPALEKLEVANPNLYLRTYVFCILKSDSCKAPSVAGDLPPPHRRTGFPQPPATLLPPDRARQACDPAARPARRSAAPRQQHQPGLRAAASSSAEH